MWSWLQQIGILQLVSVSSLQPNCVRLFRLNCLDAGIVAADKMFLDVKSVAD